MTPTLCTVQVHTVSARTFTSLHRACSCGNVRSSPMFLRLCRAVLERSSLQMFDSSNRPLQTYPSPSGAPVHPVRPRNTANHESGKSCSTPGKTNSGRSLLVAFRKQMTPLTTTVQAAFAFFVVCIAVNLAHSTPTFSPSNQEVNPLSEPKQLWLRDRI